MIDLAADIAAGGTALQTALVVGGVELPVDTSFRAWLRFGRVARELGACDPRVLLCEPVEGWQEAAASFYADRQELPRAAGEGARDRTFDPDADAPLVVAAFAQAYGIDLTDPGTDMHWHLFMALLRGVPQETQLSRVMGYRAWAPGRRSPEAVARELRDVWALPSLTDAEARRAVEYQSEWFGDVSYGGDE